MAKQLGFAPILAILLIGIILAAVGGAYYFGTYFQKQQIQPQKQLVYQTPFRVPSSSPTANSSASPDVIANWLVYQSTKNSYIVKYPPNWKKEMPSVTDNNPKQELVSLVSDTNAIPNSNTPYSVLISFYSKQDFKNVLFTKNTQQISGMTVYQSYDMPGQFGSDAVFFPTKSGDYILLRLSPFQVDKPFLNQISEQEIFNEILVTFKFIDQSPMPSVSASCLPRPACLDATPRCLIAEPINGWCQ